MSLALVRPVSAIAWDLRAAWATGRRVSVSLERADMERVEGHVFAVSPTDATVTIAGWLVPLDRVLAVHRPSRLGDSTVAAGEPWRGRARRAVVADGQDELPLHRALNHPHGRKPRMSSTSSIAAAPTGYVHPAPKVNAPLTPSQVHAASRCASLKVGAAR